MPTARPIDPVHARRLIITKQHLDAKESPAMLDTIRDLGCVQLDPIRKVERTHLLVLWSRLGNFDVEELEKLRWEERSLFEYWAHAASLVLTEDYPIHAVYMRQIAEGERIKAWIEENDLHELREHILERLSKEGALGTNDFEHEQFTNETFSGWTNGRAVNRLIERLWSMGQVMPSVRRGNQRKWTLAENFFPEWTPREKLNPHEATYHSIQRAIKALGLAGGKKQINYHFTRSRYWHFTEAMEQLLQEEKIIPVEIADWTGDWYMHSDDLPLLERIEKGDFQPKTILLSPFDNLICDRDRTELIWNFFFRIEIYVPQKDRQFGYYVLPILHGDDLIGRIDMEMNRKTKTLHANSVYAEDDAPQSAVDEIRNAVQSLADFLGAESIQYGKTAKIWKRLKA